MKDREAMAQMIYEAVRFSVWAAGEGICPIAGEPAESPEDFLHAFSNETGMDDWDQLPGIMRRLFGTKTRNTREL